MPESLSTRFLAALDATAPGNLVSAVCAKFKPEIEWSLVDTWRRRQEGFEDAYLLLVLLAARDRRGPVDEDELKRRLVFYLLELEQHHIDTGEIDRTRAAAAAGVNLTEIVARTTEGSPDFDEAFYHSDDLIQRRQVLALEDWAANFMGMPAKALIKLGEDFRRGTQITTYLKARSWGHNLPQRVRVEAQVLHGGAIAVLPGAGVYAELQATAGRFLPPPTVVMVEAS